MPFWKTRTQAEHDGDTMYQLGSKDAIKDFIERHDGAHIDAIVEYMGEVYGLDESTTRMAISDLSRTGALAPRYSGGRDASGQRAIGYDVADDGLSDWG